VFWDAAMPGFGLAVMQSGARSFVVQYRTNGHSRRLTLSADALSLEDAKREARKRLGEVAKGHDPLTEKREQVAAVQAAKGNTLRMVALDYFKREGSKIRTMREREMAFESLVFPKLGDRQIDQISRSEIVKLLDHIEDKRGPVRADKVLAFLSKLFAWHAARHDTFRSPIVRGMARTKPHERKRDRILSDTEVAAVLRTVEAAPGPFFSLVTFLLLTATRRNEAAHMTWNEVEGGAWTVPAKRCKIKRDVVLPLSKAAQSLLDAIPHIEGCPYVFNSRAKGPLRNFDHDKKRLDAACGVTGWRLHDLRRTARSLMGRAGVLPDVAERCLGHVIGGVRGTYDRHEYLKEKRKAFEALASEIDRIKRTN
jgi:integrase